MNELGTAQNYMGSAVWEVAPLLGIATLILGAAGLFLAHFSKVIWVSKARTALLKRANVLVIDQSSAITLGITKNGRNPIKVTIDCSDGIEITHSTNNNIINLDKMTAGAKNILSAKTMFICDDQNIETWKIGDFGRFAKLYYVNLKLLSALEGAIFLSFILVLASLIGAILDITGISDLGGARNWLSGFVIITFIAASLSILSYLFSRRYEELLGKKND